MSFDEGHGRCMRMGWGGSKCSGGPVRGITPGMLS